MISWPAGLSAILIVLVIAPDTGAQPPSGASREDLTAQVAAIQQRLNAAAAISGRMRMYANDELIRDARFALTDQAVFSIVDAEEQIHQSSDALWWYYPREGRYRKTAPLGPQRPVYLKFLAGLQPFVKATMPYCFHEQQPYSLELTPQAFERVNWNGQEALRVQVPFDRDPQGHFHWYMDMSARLPLGWEASAFDRRMRVVYSDIVLDPPQRPGQFDWTPPADAVAYADDSYQQTVDKVRAELLAAGASAPPFTLPRHGGGELSLAERFENNKLTLLTFWFYGCGPCLEELPHLNVLHEKFGAQGFEVIAMNAGDSPRLIDKFYAAKGYSMPVALMESDGEPDVPGAYKVVMYPTNYLIDTRGRVVKGWLGKPEDLERILKARGFGL